MSDDYSYARTMVQLQINRQRDAGDGTLTEDMIKSSVEKIMASGLASLSPQIQTTLVNEMMSNFQTWIGKLRIIVGSGSHKPWLSRRRHEIVFRFWERYEKLLVQEGWAQPTIDKVDEFTDIILDHLQDPKSASSWDRRGLVVGHVQSGKTANYTGVICKAADAGYKVIVVLAGMHKSLRTQTQIRLEEGFLGYQTPSGINQADAREPTGAGLLDPSPRATFVTTRADGGDFKRAFARQLGVDISNTNPPILFVVKKNASVLRNLVNWVGSMSTHIDENGKGYVSDVPLLVIDDEADQGSIDTRAKERDEDGNIDPDHDPTVLNERIRELLGLFSQSAYIAYTATPFANILIHDHDETTGLGDDLFPRDFIVSLPAPSNYVGPVRVFGLSNSDEAEPPLPIIRVVSDYAETEGRDETRGWVPPKHNKTHDPYAYGAGAIPESLFEAMKAFVLVCATRTARGDGKKHNSMLIHVTRFTAVQKGVADQVKEALNALRHRIKLEKGDNSGVLTELRQLWERDFEPTSTQINAADCDVLSWGSVRDNIWNAIASIDVKEVNGRAGDILDYDTQKDEGLNVIAIGGDKLSRGLTLEGLSISYFLRASRMYDTLMQMGRWFGYRPRYMDLCRIYTTSELIDWFEHITKASEELREEFNAMANANQTPRDYGQRVLAHPDLLVTSQVKMRDGERVRVTFAGSICETIGFHRNKDKVEANFCALESLVDRLGGADAAGGSLRTGAKTGKKLVFHGVASDLVLDFLSNYSAHGSARKVKPALLRKYIQKLQPLGELTTWTIAVLSGDGGENKRLGAINEPLRPVVRSWHPKKLDLENDGGLDMTTVFKIRRLVSPTDEGLDFNAAEYESAMELTGQTYTQDGGRQKDNKPPGQPSGLALRSTRPADRGLLLIYPLAPGGADGAGGSVTPAPAELGVDGPPLVGIAISFPNSDNRVTVEYVVNNVYSSQEFGES